MKRNCKQCIYLKRTSPSQKFLRCDFWAAKHHTNISRYVPAGWDCAAYSTLHCHVQPDAPACRAFEPVWGKDAAA